MDAEGDYLSVITQDKVELFEKGRLIQTINESGVKSIFVSAISKSSLKIYLMKDTKVDEYRYFKQGSEWIV